MSIVSIVVGAEERRDSTSALVDLRILFYTRSCCDTLRTLENWNIRTLRERNNQRIRDQRLTIINEDDIVANG